MMKRSLIIIIFILVNVSTFGVRSVESSSSINNNNKNEIKNRKKIAFIPNGWIEIVKTTPKKSSSYFPSSPFFQFQDDHFNFIDNFLNTNAYIFKCNNHYQANSLSRSVRPFPFIDPLNINVWQPEMGYIVNGLPLCTQTCTFQSNLTQGFIEIESKPLSIFKNNNILIAQKNDRLKFECLTGYTLMTCKVNKNGQIEMKRNDDAIVVNGRQVIIKACEYDDDDDDEDNDDDNQTISISIPKKFYRCEKFCSSGILKMNEKTFTLPKRKSYIVNERINVSCNNQNDVASFENHLKLNENISFSK
jgi:hypothetical protein